MSKEKKKTPEEQYRELIASGFPKEMIVKMPNGGIGIRIDDRIPVYPEIYDEKVAKGLIKDE